MNKGFLTHAEAADATGYVADNLYWVAGQTVLGDAGAGVYKFDPDSVAGASATVIVITAGGRLLMVSQTTTAVATALSVLIGDNLRAGADIPVVTQENIAPLLPASLGAKALADSLAVTLATDEPTVARIGATNESAPGSDTAASGLNGRLQRVAQNITTQTSKLPAALAAGGGLKIEGVAGGVVVPVTDAATVAAIVDVESEVTASIAKLEEIRVLAADSEPVTVNVITVRVSGSAILIRPANTTPYSVGDYLANSTTAGSVVDTTFAVARANGLSGVIMSAIVEKSSPVVTNASLRLHFFGTILSHQTAGDNSPVADVVVGLTKGYFGYLDIPTFTGFGNCAIGASTYSGGVPFIANGGVTTIYMVPEWRDTYTPISAEEFRFSLMVGRD